jgi:hypothetical protein
MSDQPNVLPSGKARADYFAAVRARGMLNARMDTLSEAFERANPSMKTKWEWYPANGDNSLVTAREAMGFIVVDAADVPGTESSQKSGPIRVGDMVLMAAPADLMDAILALDAEAAEQELRQPERVFRESLERNKVRLPSTGEEDYARPIGRVTQKTEFLFPQGEKGGDS